MSSPLIEPVKDIIRVTRFESLLENILERPNHFKMSGLVTMRWVAVPVESACHFDDNDAELLSKAFQFIGCKECFAVATEPMGEYPHCYKISPKKSGLLEFSKECGHLNFILVPENVAFAVLCTVYDYYIVAGPSEFVQMAIGDNIQDARAKFQNFALSVEWTEFDRSRLLSVANRYSSPALKNMD